jgi:hypothetical protein
MLWEKRGSRLLLKNNAVHTCRNFDAIHAWTSDRQIDYETKKELASGELHIVD